MKYGPLEVLKQYKRYNIAKDKISFLLKLKGSSEKKIGFKKLFSSQLFLHQQRNTKILLYRKEGSTVREVTSRSSVTLGYCALGACIASIKALAVSKGISQDAHCSDFLASGYEYVGLFC